MVRIEEEGSQERGDGGWTTFLTAAPSQLAAGGRLGREGAATTGNKQSQSRMD